MKALQKIDAAISVPSQFLPVKGGRGPRERRAARRGGFVCRSSLACHCTWSFKHAQAPGPETTQTL